MDKKNSDLDLQVQGNRLALDIDFKKCDLAKINELVLSTLKNHHNKNVVVDLEMSIPTRKATLIVFWDTGYEDDAKKVIKCIEDVCQKL